MLNGNTRDDRATDAPRYARRALAYAAVIAAFGAFMSAGIVKCPVATMLHVPCPGCGTTRAALALFALDPSAAFRFNPVAPLVLVALAGLAWRAVWLAYREGDARRIDEEPLGRFFVRAFLVVTIAEIVVWALRFAGLFGGPCPV